MAILLASNNDSIVDEDIEEPYEPKLQVQTKELSENTNPQIIEDISLEHMFMSWSS